MLPFTPKNIVTVPISIFFFNIEVHYSANLHSTLGTKAKESLQIFVATNVVNNSSRFFIICYNNIVTFLNLYSEEGIVLASSYLWTS